MMLQQLTRIASICLMSVVVAGCGNKGELFLPPDAQLADELDTPAAQRINPPVPLIADPADDDKPRRKQHTDQ